MLDETYITGISTIISNFRRVELGRPLDATHVRRWIKQFQLEERGVVLRETFFALSRNYYKEERLHNYIDRTLEKLLKELPADQIVFAETQEQGYSQKLIYDYIRSKGNFVFQKDSFFDAEKWYVYIDDGLYSGRRTRDDIRYLISVLPEGARLSVSYMVAFSDGYDYWSGELKREAMSKQIIVDFTCDRKFDNKRNQKLEKRDFLWPDESCRELDEVANYEKRLGQVQKVYYLYNRTDTNNGVCSSIESYKELTRIFLKYGIRIASQMKSNVYLPLGLSNRLSFGFGSIVATDWNIANNCPLVLWWGDIDDPNSMVGGWYPLLPRRNSKVLYQEMCKFEESISIAENAEMLKTVYSLAHMEYRQNHEKNSCSTSFDMAAFDLYEIPERRRKSDLLQYMNTMDMEKIQLIQTVMYIGRDYHIPSESEEDFEEYCGDYEEEYSARRQPDLRVDDPDLLIHAWLEDLTWAKGWNAKSIEIQQIYGKRLVLHRYLKRAFEILGI